jgi:hypothetical protein
MECIHIIYYIILFSNELFFAVKLIMWTIIDLFKLFSDILFALFKIVLLKKTNAGILDFLHRNAQLKFLHN